MRPMRLSMLSSRAFWKSREVVLLLKFNCSCMKLSVSKELSQLVIIMDFAVPERSSAAATLKDPLAVNSHEAIRKFRIY